MFLAVVSVSVLIWLILGRRESLVVLTAIPVTLALTLFVFYLYGYTLNRITLFALIFSIGILVDDAIVVVENIVRHARMSQDGRDLAAIAVRAVDEVGNPTILATLAVIAAILPMAFVGGLMGPYMRPIPVGASAAMVFSLVVAFIVTPWAAVRLLRRPHAHEDEPEDRLTALYRRVMRPLLARPAARAGFLGLVAVLLARRRRAGAAGPRDGEDAAVRQQERAAGDRPHAGGHAARNDRRRRVGARRRVAARRGGDERPELHRRGVAVHVQRPGAALLPPARRQPRGPAADAGRQGRAARAEPRDREADPHHGSTRSPTRLGARIQVVEVPPGPPVLQTIVAEVYGPDASRRLELARTVRSTFERTPGVVDVDWYVESRQPKLRLEVDGEKAAAAGLSAAQIASVVSMAGAGMPAGLLHDPRAREDVPIVLRLPRRSARLARRGAQHPRRRPAIRSPSAS